MVINVEDKRIEEIINQLMKSSRVHGWVYRQKRRSWTRWLMIDYFEHLFIWAWRLFLEKPSKGNVGSFETRGVFRVWFASQCATFLKVGINLRVLGQEPIKELRQAPSLLFSLLYQWLSMVINGYQWLSMVINGYQWLSMVSSLLLLLAQDQRKKKG